MLKKLPVILPLLFLFAGLRAQNTGSEYAIAEKQDTASLSVVQKVERWYGQNMNYLTITTLMTVESSFIPFPSEIVVPPAAYIASNNDPEINKNNLNIVLVVVFATLGAMVGSFINYFLALWLGRPILYKFADSKIGRLLLLSSEKIQKAEAYFNNRGKISTFVGRLIPGVRQLISIPAGLAKMNILSFALYTALGASVWNITLALLGYIAHGQADLINKYSHELSLIILGALGLAVLYFIVKLIRKGTEKATK
jgi:membrane protein DedA with SNARE-associated domain